MERLAATMNEPLFRRSTEGGAVSLVVGKVTADHGVNGVEIEVGAELLSALVGFGCLVRPIAGDRVLAARTPGGVFLLSVLERLVPDSATLSLPSGGSLVVEAEDIGLVARREFSLDARAVSLRSQKFNVIADALTLLARSANWVADQLRVTTKTQETVADTISSKSLDRVSIVERADMLTAHTLSQTVNGVAITTAPIAAIAASEDLRLDAKRVTVG